MITAASAGFGNGTVADGRRFDIAQRLVPALKQCRKPSFPPRRQLSNLQS
jgi:hypothetical protein